MIGDTLIMDGGDGAPKTQEGLDMTTIYRLTEDLDADIRDNDSVCFSSAAWMVEAYEGNHLDSAETIEIECPVDEDDIADEETVLEYRDDARAQVGMLAYELLDERWVRRDLWDRGYRGARVSDTDNGCFGGAVCETVRVFYRRA